MLPDIDRKIFRIIKNCERYGVQKITTLSEFKLKLCCWTGKTEMEIQEVLDRLENRNMILLEGNSISSNKSH